MHITLICCNTAHGLTPMIMPKHDMSYDVSTTPRSWVLSTFPLTLIFFHDPTLVIYHIMAHMLGKSTLSEL